MSLNYEKKQVYEGLKEKEIAELNEYIREYMDFMTVSKTEYETVVNMVEMLEENGFKEIATLESVKPGDKVYFVNKEKSIYAAVIGKQDTRLGIRLIGAHLDSPRLDLKPMPLYENAGMALLKTQYYGGIKKYQWMTTPLSMHGVIYNKNNEKIKVVIGEKEDEPCFIISDLLPHLAKDQMKVSANEFIDPEKMSIIFGSFKLKSDKKEENTVKQNILSLLNKKYGIEEIDFARSEISFVPVNKPRFIGMDKSMIGAYGHDDRVCSYAALKALLHSSSEKTIVTMLVDKEEIGSVGNTSMESAAFDMFIYKIIKLKQEKDVDLNEVYFHSKMLSADVSSCMEPCYDEFSDKQNANWLGYGVSIEKYTGSGGKVHASDANASYVSEIMYLFDQNEVAYQMGTLGKIEKGGGGTIAYILANKGMDVIDCGTPVLSMHAPYEIVSVADTYMTYKAYLAFLRH